MFVEKSVMDDIFTANESISDCISEKSSFICSNREYDGGCSGAYGGAYGYGVAGSDSGMGVVVDFILGAMVDVV